jgi:lysophospholipase L1-like esterase
MRKYIIVTYIICIHAILGVVLIKDGPGKRTENITVTKETAKSELTEHFHHMVLYHSRMDGNVPAGSIVFIGDSITQGLCVTAVAPSAINHGIGYDTTAGVLQRLPVYGSIKRAGAVVVAIGINDFRLRTNEDILHNYKMIAEKIPEGVPVVFSAVFPLDEKCFFDCQGWNRRIQALNIELKAFCSASKNHYFVDAGPLLLDAQGNLAAEFHDNDGIHLNSQGNAIWIGELQKTLREAQVKLASNEPSSRFDPRGRIVP